MPSGSLTAYLCAFDDAQDLQFKYRPFLDGRSACHSWQDFLLQTKFGTQRQIRPQLRVLLSPKGPTEPPCRSRSFLPIKGLNKAQRAPSLPDHRTCGQDFASDKCRAQPNQRHKPVVVLIHPTGPHKRPAAPGAGCTYNPRLCIQNP